MYRIIDGVFSRPHAYGKRYSTIDGAFCDMGKGIVIDDTMRIVAFHESHLRFIE